MRSTIAIRVPRRLAALALVFARRERAKLALAALWIVIGFAGSLGLHFVFHEFLFGGVPGFRAIRVPARWAVIAYIGIAILIALFTAAIRQRWLRWLVRFRYANARSQRSSPVNVTAGRSFLPCAPRNTEGSIASMSVSPIATVS